MKRKKIELKDSGVLFNKELHEYWLDGKQLSGITEMLQRQLFPGEFDGVPEAAIDEAARYGTEVHGSNCRSRLESCIPDFLLLHDNF